ncbi:MAG: hydroxyacid dehydrogenase [Planctomycetota bacterium]
MSASRLRIILAEPYADFAVQRLQAVGEVVQLQSADEKTVTDAIPGADALLVRSNVRVTREMLAKADRLKVIGRAGVGLELIDVEAATEKGIQVVYTPEAATDAVADLTVGMMIDLIRCVTTSDRMIRVGQFTEARTLSLGRELSEMTLGVIGLGRIGFAVARRCHLGFGVTVVYNDIVEPPSQNFPLTFLDKNRLYEKADIVSLHVPLTPATRHLINEDALNRFRQGAILINTARGGVVDSIALAEALRTGRLAGAALDVFDPEPLPMDHPLMSAPHTLFTPHIGARTVGGLERMHNVVDDVIRVLKCQPPHYPALG